MSATFAIDEKTGRAYARIPLSSAKASTFHSDSIKMAAVAEATSLIREAHMIYLHTLTLPEIGDDYSDEEEAKWNAFFARPDTQAALERLAEEAERQFAAGETEEGGFAVE